MTTAQSALFAKKDLIKAPGFRKSNTPFLIKLLNWEYWSFGAIYMPIYFYWFYLCFKAKNFFFFSAANPTIENGGFLMEKKSDIYSLLPSGYYPKTKLIAPGLPFMEIENILNEEKFDFPVIVKPDIGGKGRGVRKIDTAKEAIEYIIQCNFPMLVQEYIPYEKEVGIFYYRYPWESKGKISGIVEKEFLTLIGDGINSLEQLIMLNPRYILQLNALKKMPGLNLDEVPAKGEKKIVLPIGNHARGAKFIDVSDKNSPRLENAIDAICQDVNGFYFGRLDIKFNDWQELAAGKNLSIIELNGAGSEPTHMYDPNHSLFYAWKEIIRHLRILFRISTWNHKQKKIAYLSFSKGIKMFRENSKTEKKLNGLL